MTGRCDNSIWIEITGSQDLIRIHDLNVQEEFRSRRCPRPQSPADPKAASG